MNKIDKISDLDIFSKKILKKRALLYFYSTISLSNFATPKLVR